MRELVLGSAGLIGAELLRTLEAKGHRVVGLDLKHGHDLRASVDLKLFANCDRVWFLAWDSGGAKYLEAEELQHQQYKNNCELSCRVFDALAQTKKPFLFTTSQLSSVPNAYGRTKQMAAQWSSNLGGKVARLWNVYGWEPPGYRSHVITDLVFSGLRGRVRCLTNGQEKRRFLYKSDCVDALINFFESPLLTADMAGPQQSKISEAAKEVARQLNVGVEFGEVKGSEAPIEPTELLPQLNQKVSLADGITAVIADARALRNKD